VALKLDPHHQKPITPSLQGLARRILFRPIDATQIWLVKPLQLTLSPSPAITAPPLSLLHDQSLSAAEPTACSRPGCGLDLIGTAH
jgi:hypothetical protein